MLAIVALPLAVGIAITAASIVRLTRGFDQSIPALQILAPSIALLFVNNAFIYTLTAINRQADFTRLALGTLVVNAVLNLALIAPFGYLGAAVASTLTELALFVGGWWLLRRHLVALPIIRSIGPVLISAAIMGAALYLARSFTLLLLVPLAVIVYLGGLIIFRALNAEELSILRASFTNR
jgi:O-antigen/teichoic acid export membrane protein